MCGSSRGFRQRSDPSCRRGPAGLTAAITLAHAGRRVVVHEAQQEVGHRFGADLQGLENASTKDDGLDVLGAGDYDATWHREIRPAIETSIVNRAVYSLLGSRGYRCLLRGQASSRDARRFVGRLYGTASVRRLLLPWARRRVRSQRVDGLQPGREC